MAHFITHRRVEFCDTDMAGIIHFANYYKYMEQAEHALFRTVGLKIHGHLPDGTKYGWPRVMAVCTFLAPALYSDLLEIRITVVERAERMLHAKYEFFRDDLLLAEGEMKTVFCVFPAGQRMQSAAMPPDITGPLDNLMTTTEPLINDGP